MSYERFLPAAGGWLTLSFSSSSVDASWQQEVLPFQPTLNESKPAWGWEDEQGFSALRHSGRTTAPRAPHHIPPTEVSYTSMQHPTLASPALRVQRELAWYSSCRSNWGIPSPQPC